MTPEKNQINDATCPEDIFGTDVEKAYKQLAKALHPDKGGSTNDFQKLQQWYSLAKAKMQAGDYVTWPAPARQTL